MIAEGTLRNSTRPSRSGEPQQNSTRRRNSGFALVLNDLYMDAAYCQQERNCISRGSIILGMHGVNRDSFSSFVSWTYQLNA
jgi:hypothetical protein